LKFLKVFFRFAQAYLYYPVFIGAFLWLYVKGAHWGYGLAVIAAMLYFDRIWRTMARTAWHKWKHRK